MMKKSTVIKIIAAAVVLLIVFVIINDFSSGFLEPHVFMESGQLVIDCRYGVTLSKGEINSAKLLEEIPPLNRGSGFGFGNIQKGEVRVSNLGEGLAYVNLTAGRPYIYLDLTSIKSGYVFLNLHDSGDTRKLYESISAWLQS